MGCAMGSQFKFNVNGHVSLISEDTQGIWVFNKY